MGYVINRPSYDELLKKLDQLGIDTTKIDGVNPDILHDMIEHFSELSRSSARSSPQSSGNASQNR
ncbi:hypothetical protein [Dongshaea marina]|uniref:hypothetical protein n=1 Tax=Dongshaea marina TaxID=2047966 RepID=UPI000D3ED4A3|nr:hypothetical protein [Dongshaea marina]